MSEPTQHRQAYAYCAYCPKICRFSCPVSEATHSETTSAWGKMTSAFLMTEGHRPVEEGGAKALYACTGCMRCRSFCKHDNEVGFALFSARALAVEKEVAPRGARTTVDTFRQHHNPFGPELGSAVARHPVDTPVRYALFPGCSSLVKEQGLVEDATAVSLALNVPFGVARAASNCCGYPLYAAGDAEGFKLHAQTVAEALKPYRELAVLDPGCAYTFKVVYPRAGVELKTEIKTVYEILAERVGHEAARPKLEEKAAYHDACHLGRGLGQYEEPRRLLASAVAQVVEARDNRSQGGCSGGGGLVPRTMVETSVEMARNQAGRVAPAGETIVTACPTSKRMFERAGRRAANLLNVVRRWLEGRG